MLEIEILHDAVGTLGYRCGVLRLFRVERIEQGIREQLNLHAGQQEANQNAGTEEIIDAGDSDKEDESAQDCFVLPIWPSYSSTITPALTTDDKREGPREEEQVFMDDLERLKRQEKEANEEAEVLRKKFEHLVIKEGAARTSSTNIFSTVSTPAKASMNVSPIPQIRIPLTHLRALIPEIPNVSSSNKSKRKYNSGAQALLAMFKSKRELTIRTFIIVYLLVSCLNMNPRRFQKLLKIANLPYGKKAIGTKWVYRNKKDERGVVVRNKARHKAIRIFLAFASFMGFIVYQMDVKSAFLYGKIDEEVYVSQPPGFQDPKYPKKVYKVVKALYGLHQAPRAWYATLSTFLLKNGYRRGTIDKTLFLKKDKNDIILVQVYVDDIIFGSTKKSWCDEFEALMKSRFQMSSMGELTFFLGLQVKQKPDGIFISQDKYVAEILKKFDFANVKTASTPIETQKPLVKDEEASDVDVHLYRSMIGSLMYLTASRPDIMFAVCACSRFQVTPKTSHLSAVKRIFKYLKGKPKLSLWYPRLSSFDLESYSDSDYAGANLDRKSITGGCQFLGRRLISWQCKKQTIVATSTTEAEYVAAASCYGQVLWIQNQMLDYGFNFMNTKIYIDNESTICIVKNPVYHSKTKHIAIRHHFIRDAYEKKLIQVLKIHTDDNVADLLTKAFDVSRFQGLLKFRELLSRVTNGTEALLIPTLFFLWLDKVSTASAKLVPLGKVCTALEMLKKNTAKALISIFTTISLPSTMAVLDSCPKHNMVAYLEKSEGNAEFHEIIDFLKRSSIHHALTVQPTQDEGASSERPSEALPTPSPAPTSEIPREPQLSQTLYQQAKEYQQTMKAQITKLKKQAKPTQRITTLKVVRRKYLDEDKEIEENVLSTDKEGVSTDIEKVSTDRPIKVESTAGEKKGTVRRNCCSRATKHPLKTPTSKIFVDDETIAKVPQHEKKKIEEEDESESESDGIPQAEKKFKQLESDEELARKMQEEWEEEEERNRIAEEQAANEALIRNFDDIKARIEADRLLAEKL
ncbi:putative ribonuclease H-like domain-containing protein [Tanacetum coccineum]